MKIIVPVLIALATSAHADNAEWEAEKTCLEARYKGPDGDAYACVGVDLGVTEEALYAGIAAWRSTLTSEGDGRALIARAAILTDSDTVLYAYLIAGQAVHEPEALPLLILAERLGASRQRNARGESWAQFYLARYTEEERAQGETALAELLRGVSLKLDKTLGVQP